MTLEAWYPLTETSGSAQDYSANAGSGTLSGGVTQSSTGPMSYDSYNFNGTDGEVDITSIPSFGTSYTLMAWAKHDDATETDIQRIFNATQNNGAMLQFDGANGQVWSSYHFGTSPVELVGSAAVTGEWVHLAVTWDGATVRLYENGQFTDSDTVSDMDANADGDAIGYWPGGPSQYFNGSVFDARAYSHALSSQEVSYVYEVSQSATYTSNKRTL